MVRQFSILALLFALSLCEVTGQIIISGGASLEVFKHHAQTIDEFMSRFNACAHTDTASAAASDARLQGLKTLFNYDLGKEQGIDATLYAFCDSALSNNVELHFADTTWLAEAQAEITYKKKRYPISVFLQTCQYAEGQYKWVIVGVKGMYQNGLLGKDGTGAINPSENEVDFVLLESIMEHNSDSVHKYRKPGYDLDGLTAFLALAQLKIIKWQGVQKVVYHLSQVPGFVVRVEHFMRESENGGFLISKVEPVAESRKAEFFRHLMND